MIHSKSKLAFMFSGFMRTHVSNADAELVLTLSEDDAELLVALKQIDARLTLCNCLSFFVDTQPSVKRTARRCCLITRRGSCQPAEALLAHTHPSCARTQRRHNQVRRQQQL